MYRPTQPFEGQSVLDQSIRRFAYRARFLRLVLAGTWLVLLPLARAVDPPPDGGYPDENTALGEDALFNLILGSTGANTGIGFQALYNNTTGGGNTGVGDNVLHSNTTAGGNTATGYWALHEN